MNRYYNSRGGAYFKYELRHEHPCPECRAVPFAVFAHPTKLVFSEFTSVPTLDWFPDVRVYE